MSLSPTPILKARCGAHPFLSELHWGSLRRNHFLPSWPYCSSLRFWSFKHTLACTSPCNGMQKMQHKRTHNIQHTTQRFFRFFRFFRKRIVNVSGNSSGYVSGKNPCRLVYGGRVSAGWTSIKSAGVGWSRWNQPTPTPTPNARKVICDFCFCQAGNTANTGYESQLARHRNRQNAWAGKVFFKELVDFKSDKNFICRRQPWQRARMPVTLDCAK